MADEVCTSECRHPEDVHNRHRDIAGPSVHDASTEMSMKCTAVNVNVRRMYIEVLHVYICRSIRGS